MNLYKKGIIFGIIASVFFSFIFPIFILLGLFGTWLQESWITSIISFLMNPLLYLFNIPSFESSLLSLIVDFLTNILFYSLIGIFIYWIFKKIKCKKKNIKK